MNYDTFVASRIDSHRAAALARENELLRSQGERGVAVRRPVVDARRRLSGAWWAVFGRIGHGHRPVAHL
ncbi:hypothetical protein P5G50_08890 [Leifsonia sp. F6_8S_P_1B]|uniref:Uncharacterized protein n=1 Tax=Leifsonia williamsii TaxID=3035919 RepID=A0ABT8KDN8_9MICO|nr:hypothetical protein [Leifsonia williamsii]MDN4614567.1 hypothetical protein [Leifsonia williamsii]